MLGQVLQGSGLTIDAIEPNTEWADIARPFYRQVFATTVEGAQLPAGRYEAIVCADVLEHLADPLAVLKQLRDAATPDALFLVSLPNIAHVSVRMMLLAGRFPKMERGILDRTHLQFFTRDTAADLLKSAGLQIEKITPTGLPIEHFWTGAENKPFFRLLRGGQNVMLDLVPRLAAYQWVFQARRRN